MDTKNSLEVAGKTPEEAIAKGLEQLGLDSDDVIIEVLGEANGEARVRLTPFPMDAQGSARVMPSAISGDVSIVSKDVLEHLLQGVGIRGMVEVSQGTLAED